MEKKRHDDKVAKDLAEKKKKEKLDKFWESVSKESTQRDKPLSAREKLKQDKEKKEADAKALKDKEELELRKRAEEIKKSKNLIDFMVKQI